MKGETKNGDIPCAILNHDCGRSIYFTPKFFDIRLCQALLLGASTVCLDNMVQRCEDALGDLLFCGRIPSWRKPVWLVGWWVFDGFEKRGGWWDATDISIDKTCILMASESNPLRYPLSEIWPCDHFSHYFSLNKAGQKEAPVDQSVYLSRNQIAWGVSIEFHLATVLSWSWNPRISGRTHFLLWHVWCWEIFIGSTRHKVGMLFLLPWLFLDGFHYPSHLSPYQKDRLSFFVFLKWKIEGSFYMQASCPKQMWKHMCWRPNSHWFPVVRDGHQTNSQVLYTHCKDSLFKGWLGDGFKYVSCLFYFDYYFSDGLKPPTRWWRSPIKNPGIWRKLSFSRKCLEILSSAKVALGGKCTDSKELQLRLYERWKTSCRSCI